MYVCKLGKSRQGCLELTRWRKAHQSCWTLNDLYIQYTTRISLDSIGTSTPPRPSQGFQTQIQSARLPQATPATINRTTHPAHRSRDHPDHRRRPTGRNEKKKKKKRTSPRTRSIDLPLATQDSTFPSHPPRSRIDWLPSSTLSHYHPTPPLLIFIKSLHQIPPFRRRTNPPILDP